MSSGYCSGCIGWRVGTWFLVCYSHWLFLLGIARDLGSPLYERLFPGVHEVQLHEILGSSIPKEARTSTPEMSRQRRIDNPIEQSKMLGTEFYITGACSGGIPNPVIPIRL